MPSCSSERTIARLDWAAILANDEQDCTPRTQLSSQNGTPRVSRSGVRTFFSPPKVPLIIITENACPNAY